MQNNFGAMTFANYEEEIESLDGKFLTFWTDHQLFGIPIADVVQIIGIQEITPVPEYPNYAKGIINLRGNIIPIIDVRLRLHRAEMEYNERTCIIVTNIKETYIGFIVDAVDEVTDIDEKDICPPPQIMGENRNTFITGVGKLSDKVVLLLDTMKILDKDEVEQLLCTE
ncbi:chemotaxis protein CheW [Hydrogenoanaerobacterium sp.]|uniref:chemotaxis protein CheW n=1 Tax=Hydrogenoanaerobacterium sp. TaxID=2953763 RepID=UPI0028A00CDA|nr:chemotaxis protein CheW [Hydrogenoanaerobacterium sp.]